MRLRPLTPGCTACAHHGRAAHGFRHSVVCQKRRHEWLAEQEEPPLAKAVRAQGEDDEPQPVKPRLMTKAEIAAGSCAAAADAVQRPKVRLRQKTDMESDIGRKRKSEEAPEALDEERAHREEVNDDVKMMAAIEMLEEEAKMVTDQPLPEEQIRLENGVDWAPKSWTIAGDLKELQGLFDK